MSSETLHEDPAKLGPKVIDHHRAIVSLMEELEAVDWYDQRAKATDESRAARHPRAQPRRGEGARGDGARVAAAATIRSSTSISGPTCSREGPITGIEAEAAHGAGRMAARAGGASDGSLGIGSLRTAGGGKMNHLFRERAPITVSRLGRDREGSQAHAARAAGGPPGRRLPAARWAGAPPTSSSAAADPIASPPTARTCRPACAASSRWSSCASPSTMSRAELDAIDRGARDPDLDTVTAAAREIAIAEDRSIFHGYDAAHITGICQARAQSARAARQQPRRLSRRRRRGAHQAARRRRRGPLRRGAERAALQGSLRPHRRRLSRSSATSNA